VDTPLLNLRHFLKKLRSVGEVVDVHEEVDPHLEIAEIHRRVAAANGPALFFHTVKHSSFPVVTNLFGSNRRVELAFPHRPERVVAKLVEFLTGPFPPKLKNLWDHRKDLKHLLTLGTKWQKRAPVLEHQILPVDLEKLPLLKTWSQDGGHFITLPLVYTESPGRGAPNLGMYRIQRYDKKTTGLHFQIQKGGGFHYHQAELCNQALPVTIFIGGSPALMLSAITPLPENVSELLVAGLMQGDKLGVTRSPVTPHPILAECEFALIGKAPPHIRHPEGPFGDHYGYYSWIHDFPIFNCLALYHRKDAIYPATVVGKPRQEDFYIGDFLQEMLSPLFPVVMPGVKALWSYGECGFHSLAAAVVRERYYRECMASAFRILGEGQLSLTKFLLLTDTPVDLRHFPTLLTHILERFCPETDLFIFSNLSLDTLDYTGPALNKGSRGVMLGIGSTPLRDLPKQFQGILPKSVTALSPFIPGCLVLEGIDPQVFTHPDFANWPLLILVDNLNKTLESTTSFLWTVFTRFEPAADIYGTSCIVRNHVCFTGPILIDARMKPTYPPELICDEATAAQVTQKWHHYFPNGMEMGVS
jgi:4-hydroxybenzoate decarboxylase subunit C